MKFFSFVCMLCSLTTLSLFAAPPPTNGVQPPRDAQEKIETRPAGGAPKVDGDKSKRSSAGKGRVDFRDRYHDGKHFEGGAKQRDKQGEDKMLDRKYKVPQPNAKPEPPPPVKPVPKPAPVPKPIAPPPPAPVLKPIAPPPPKPVPPPEHGKIPPPRPFPMPHVDVLVIPSPIGSTTPKGWFDDWDVATREARRHNRPILVLFSGSDWCKWCKALRREVLDTAEFMNFAAKNLILVYMDTPSDRRLPKRLEQTRARLRMMLQAGDVLPCTYILSPNEDTWKKIEGFDRDYLNIIKRALHKHGY